MKKVDIIIPVHNRWDHTRQTLDSLLANTDKDLYELYVINDGSDQNTSADLYGYCTIHQEVNLMHPYQIAIGPGASRNWVTKRITDNSKRSKYLYHSDNDVFFTPGWLDKLINAYESINYLTSEKILVIGGGCHPYLQDKEKVIAGVDTCIGIKDAVSGYSQLMTWETWDKYGPFDETMRNAEKKIMGSEDWAFCQKIIKDGFKVGSIEPEVVIATGKTNTYGDPATGSETFKEVEGVIIK